MAAPRGTGETRIELDGYPDFAPARDVRPGELPPGFGLATFAVRDLDAVLARAAQAGHPSAPPSAVTNPPTTPAAPPPSAAATAS